MSILINLPKSNKNHDIKFQGIKAVIFDVDGTFYSLKKMSQMVRMEMLKYYLKNPQEIQDIKIVINFIRERERRAFDIVDNLENRQYEWAAKAAKVSVEKVRAVVQKWIFQVPLQHIYSCSYPEVLELFNKLTNWGIATGIFSDYPAQAKLAKLGLSTSCIISATDENVGRLKPDPKGLLLASEILQVSIKNCLFIGDRDDRDGECARKAGMPYLILGKGQNILPAQLFSNQFSEVK